MSLTLANAAAVLGHQNPTPRTRGYTRTMHHAAHLAPGALWRAVDGEDPRTAVLVRSHRDGITVTDQFGSTFIYSRSAVIATAVPDSMAAATGSGSPAGPAPSQVSGRRCGWPRLSALQRRRDGAG